MLFDGVCNVCNASVRFVVEHEQSPVIKFASLQSDEGAALVRAKGLANDLDTVVLVDGDRVFTKSSAAVRALRYMKAPWRWLGPLLWIVPKPVRDLGYVIFAKNRYRLFGKS